MSEYIINAKDLGETDLNRTIKEQAPNHNKIIINKAESSQTIWEVCDWSSKARGETARARQSCAEP